MSSAVAITTREITTTPFSSMLFFEFAVNDLQTFLMPLLSLRRNQFSRLHYMVQKSRATIVCCHDGSMVAPILGPGGAFLILCAYLL